MKSGMLLYDVVQKLDISIEEAKEVLRRSGYIVESVKDYRLDEKQLNILTDVFSEVYAHSIIQNQEYDRFDKWAATDFYYWNKFTTPLISDSFFPFQELEVPKVRFGFSSFLTGIKVLFGYKTKSEESIVYVDTLVNFPIINNWGWDYTIIEPKKLNQEKPEDSRCWYNKIGEVLKEAFVKSESNSDN